ncbi:LysR family transcriptional regulator [Streptomyces iconiensis]|uniref:LysR family transcriptional regulator n=1 Tax=Streptomyces iconiensis TaxID=1384038 RepID=A0ABT6ZZE1_9ACTN|nr:LysR family transcriptional regulator [Streptomyces iconiensis]MDJ1134436.1 LysR family transcriptional regulator [Streptomyces iconiensis]
MPDLTLIGLRVVYEVFSTGSFTAAAESLGHTQSAVSRQVGAVEAAVGVPLFERSARGTGPTAAGTALARHAADVLAGVDAAVQEVSALRDRMSGRVTVGAFPIAAAVLGSRALAQLASEHPGLEVSFEEASSPALLRRLRGDRLQVAVIGACVGPPHYDMAGLRQETLVEDDLRVAVPRGHRFAARTRIQAEELRGEGWIVERGSTGDPQYGAWPTLSEPHIVHAAREWSTRLGMVAAGLGICLVPGLALASVPDGVRVVTVEDRHWLGRATVVVTKPHRSPQAEAAVAALREQATDVTSTRTNLAKPPAPGTPAGPQPNPANPAP